MGTFGGRRAVVRACVLAALSGSLLAGCSSALDQAHSVQTRLGRIDQVSEASVATPTDDRAAAIVVGYTGTASVRELTHLLTEIDRVADDEDYPAYRLDLTPTSAPADTLVVDETFIGSDVEAPVLSSWLAVTAALLGDVTYSYQPGNEEITVDSGAGVAHDVGEASRLGYGFEDTTWTFRDAETAFVVAGRVAPTDVVLFQAVQRSVSSASLPAPASSWHLERRPDRVVLDLDVQLHAEPAGPEQLTVARYGEDVAPLVEAALRALRTARLPIWLRLHHRTEGSDDVFAYWVAGQRPVRGRDPLLRGWDPWLAELARATR